VLNKENTIERKLKAAVYYNPQDIRIERLRVPEIEEDEILVEMKACGICGSDLMDWYLKSRAPLVLGHEPSGTVYRTGSKVREFQEGDRVFVHHHVACMTCHYCMNGDFTLCETFHNTNITPGGFAEYFKVPNSNVKTDTLKIPKKLAFEEAAFIEPVGCCIRALNRCHLAQGDSVAIIGAGTTGLIHTALSKIYGSTITIVSDLIDFRLRYAKKFGADITVNPQTEDLILATKAATDGRGVDIAVVTAPNIEAYKAGIGVCRKGGRLCVFAPTDPSKRIQIGPKELFFSELQILPSYSTSHLETRAALGLLESGKLKVRQLITHRFKLEHTAQAFETAFHNKESLKTMIFNKSSRIEE
jgi:L-iditol 2-dehydrogenase